VRRGDIVILASGSGQVVPEAELAVGFQGGGEVVEILIEIGDQVEVGQVLARVDETSAQSKLTQAEINLRELTSPVAVATAQQSLAAAQMTLEEAYYDLGYLISPSVLTWEGKVETAQQALLEAQEAAEASSSPDTLDALAEAEQALELAEQNLAYFQQVYPYYLEDIFTFTYYDPPTEIEIADARAGFALAQARVDEAVALLAMLLGEEVPPDAAGAGLVKLEQARDSLESASQDLEATRLVAPIAGVITSLNAIVGETVGSSPIVTISDLDPPMLQIYLDEMDMDKIAEGYTVEVYFDALPDESFIGHVVLVEPTLSLMQGVSTVRGLVRLDETISGGNRALPVGMNAAVDVIAARAEGVLLVPTEALRELGPGEYGVFVLLEGEPMFRVVTVGLMDYAYAEIQSGLNAGDVVTTGIVETE
jgi:RND family efflux transporter MFP subunit